MCVCVCVFCIVSKYLCGISNMPASDNHTNNYIYIYISRISNCAVLPSVVAFGVLYSNYHCYIAACANQSGTLTTIRSILTLTGFVG